MPGIATTRMSSKGRVVIPEGIRQQLGLKAGSRFVVVAGDDAIVLKPIAELDLSRFDSLVTEARKHARRAGLRKADIAEAIRTARARE